MSSAPGRRVGGCGSRDDDRLHTRGELATSRRCQVLAEAKAGVRRHFTHRFRPATRLSTQGRLASLGSGSRQAWSVRRTEKSSSDWQQRQRWRARASSEPFGHCADHKGREFPQRRKPHGHDRRIPEGEAPRGPVPRTTPAQLLSVAGARRRRQVIGLRWNRKIPAEAFAEQAPDPTCSHARQPMPGRATKGMT